MTTLPFGYWTFTPFGFAFGRHDTLVVSQAASPGGASSYALNDDGGVSIRSATVPDGQNAACWTAATENGKYAFVANAGSGNISAYRVNADGTIALLSTTGTIGAHPADEALSKGSRYLYVLLNPNSPPKDLHWGEQTTDEMCIGFLQMTFDDEHLNKKAAQPGLSRRRNEGGDL